MCGMCGFIELSPIAAAHGGMDAVLKQMTDQMVHRGPDSNGVWTDAQAGIALGHRRLAIVDLSPEGHQPMHSASQRYVVAFNGEIYNFQEIREELNRLNTGVNWRGHSDTEIMLAAIEQWGVEQSLARFTGMFAFALWDKQCKELVLARDRLGEKPLYYGWQKGSLIFGSELKSLKAYPNFENEIDRDALSLFLRHNNVPAPYSIYKGIYKLPAGHFLRFSLTEPNQYHIDEPQAYWQLSDAVTTGKASPFMGTDGEAVDALDTHLRDAISKQMLADVPLGAFLSGGTDSSTIVALMQSLADQPVRTFSIGFHEEGFDEAIYARQIAKHLGTKHTELYVTPQDALETIPSLPAVYDEPFSDASQIPTILVSKMAREQVTVALSGDAGDELFAGYDHYFRSKGLWDKLSRFPLPLRKLAAKALTTVPISTWDRMISVLEKTGRVPEALRHGRAGDRLYKVAKLFRESDAIGINRQLLSHWHDPENVVIGSKEPTCIRQRSQLEGLDHISQMMYTDTLNFLADDILVKVDRAAMSNSLETRVPFLDHNVVEFAWRLPLSQKIRDGESKWLLKQVMYQYLPKEMMERPKMGFYLPIDEWLRSDLRDWAEALLDQDRLKEEGYLNPEPIRKKWDEHLSGKRNWQFPLWDVLMFQAWLEENR